MSSKLVIQHIIILFCLFDLLKGQTVRFKRQFQSQIQGSTLNPNVVPVHDAKQSSFVKLPSSLPNQSIESIVDKFQINKNSIIRTHDSRALGAKYLNESDLSSNEDCLRWCWNTSNCNMAVYEEKTRGSCYLFDCGTLEDFKCRFTPHTFYTSSVLQVNRNSFFLNEWKSQENQENELTGLKENVQLKTNLESNVVKAPDLSKTLSQTPAKISKCRHYQFECRNNSECIAIYNVCDGIPQCSDGSDESFELECHKSRLNSVKSSTESEIDKSKLSDYYKLVNKQQISSQPQSSLPGNSIFNGKSSTDLSNNDPQKLFNYQSSYLTYNYPRSPNTKLDEEYSNKVNSPLSNEFNGYGLPSTWNQYNLAGEASGKGDKVNSFVNEPDQFNTALKESVYWPSFNYPPANPDIHPHMRQQLDIPYNLPPSVSDAHNRPTDYVQQQRQPQYQQVSQQNLYNQYLGNTMLHPGGSKLVTSTSTSSSSNSTKEKSPPKLVSTSRPISADLLASKPAFSHITSDQKKVPMRNPSIVAVSFMHDTSPPNGHDTNSAVIALTLGLFITAILIVIVGCRMKSFKKRIARRGRSLAHDSDYLVNGMYL